jgi:hypothetical protein
MMNSSSSDAKAIQSSKWWTAVGLFLFVLGLYVLSSPGRIDLIDGQVRFDVAYNWLETGHPRLGDPWVGPWMGVRGRDGFVYSYYGAPASVFAMPLVWLGGTRELTQLEQSRFLFSMTSPIFGALTALMLFLFYLELEIPLKQALAWTMVSTFATLMWPASNSSFDNAQHAFFALTGMYFGYLSAKTGSKILAGLGGLLAGVLILYQSYFLLIIPGLAISTIRWKPTLQQSTRISTLAVFSRFVSKIVQIIRSALRDPGEARESSLRFLCFLLAISVDLVLYFAYNNLRFGSYFDDGKLRAELHRAYPLFGNPFAGILTLLVSPGKSIFLYSPPIILGILGMWNLRRRRPGIAFGVFASSVVLVAFISCISFAAGDWCWGPRYLVVLLPLWALGFPFLAEANLRQNLLHAIIGLGLLIQVLGLSVEHQRFFFENGFNDYFWAEDPWIYFKHSGLFARIGETMSLHEGPPPTAVMFNSLKIPDWVTYTALGPPRSVPRRLAPQWIRNFKIYFLPRPWPFWMVWIKPALRPINLQAWLWGVVAVIATGGTCICRGLRIAPNTSTAQNFIANQELAQI